jgi:hypothetical protein
VRSFSCPDDDDDDDDDDDATRSRTKPHAIKKSIPPSYFPTRA